MHHIYPHLLFTAALIAWGREIFEGNAVIIIIIIIIINIIAAGPSGDIEDTPRSLGLSLRLRWR
jgi:hypothetical protein